ncbi:hypothetical protein NG697_12655 [Pseudarthrobacter sp. MDT3-26]|uniref:hypothetical protein n=1 Tax=Pseudarthrobacter raffinosi TaxID=2953651 RepID=UPI00208E570C|nr:hypothetical protein [Pseudarthrobacter sp. MDT3-26]MCO4263762.1 hypothetical protein [Pseudarthrobacter sp. MDT3-26]
MSVFLSSAPSLIEALIKTASAYPSTRATPSEFVKAVSVRAFALGLTDKELTLFLKKQTASHPGLSELLANRSASRRLISSCRAAARSSSPAAAAENSLKTARLTLGRILSPVPMVTMWTEPSEDGAETEPVLVPALTAARQIRARGTMAILCVEILKSIQDEKGWNTLMVSRKWLALRMNVTVITVRAALDDLVAMGWITELGGQRPDSAKRYKIGGKLTREQGHVIDNPHLFTAVGSLAGLNDEPAQTAIVTRSVTHTSWTYGDDPLTFKKWLVTLAHAAGVDPVQLGVPARSMTPVRKALTLAGLTLSDGLRIGDDNHVMDRLNEWGHRTGSFTQASGAREAYKAQAAERTAELNRVREGRAKAKKDLEKAFGPVGLIPAVDAPVDRRNAWLKGAAQALSREPIIEDRRKALQYELTRRLKTRGYKGDVVIRLVEHLLSHAPALLAEEAIPASTEEPAVKQQWLQGAAAAVSGRVMRSTERDAFSDEIFRKLRRRGYEKTKAQQLSGLILGEVHLAEAA